jgi:hypothetical protein
VKKTLVLILACFGIFIAGAVTGGFVAARNVKTVTHRRAMEQFTQVQLKRLADQLQLTPEQRVRIRGIATRAGRDVQLRRREILDILDRMETEMKGELTPEQLARFEKIRNRVRDDERSFQKILRERRMMRGEGAVQPAPERTESSPGEK